MLSEKKNRGGKGPAGRNCWTAGSVLGRTGPGQDVAAHAGWSGEAGGLSLAAGCGPAGGLASWGGDRKRAGKLGGPLAWRRGRCGSVGALRTAGPRTDRRPAWLPGRDASTGPGSDRCGEEPGARGSWTGSGRRVDPGKKNEREEHLVGCTRGGPWRWMQAATRPDRCPKRCARSAEQAAAWASSAREAGSCRLDRALLVQAKKLASMHVG
jgi:hypothetical protein